LAQWQPGSVIDVQAEMARLTLDILGATVFTTDFGTFLQRITRAMEATIRISTMTDTGIADPLAQQELDQAINELDAVVQHLVATRRLEPIERNDILQVLLDAVAQENPLFHDTWVRDEAVTLIVAGHDTTALTATMALYLLARNPEVTATLRDELRRALARGVPEAQLADEVALARHVVEETLRLYPPLPTLTRSVTHDIELGGYRIKAGTVLMFSAWLTQRDARFFPEPLHFDPWRFAGERRKRAIGPAYFPFGAGPRICVGNHFALLEAAVVVALTTLHTELELLEAGEPVMAPLNVLRCRDGLRARVRPAPVA
jgi:cytochrome P450